MQKETLNKVKSALPKLTLALSTIALLAICMLAIGLPYQHGLSEGEISLSGIYSPYDITVRSGVDEAATERLRQEARGAVWDIYSSKPEVLDEIKKGLSDIFKKYIEARGLEGAYVDLEAFDKQETDIAHILDDVFSRPIVFINEKERLMMLGRNIILIKPGSGEGEYKAADFRVVEEVKKELPNLVRSNLNEDKRLKTQVIEYLQSQVVPNIQYNSELLKERQRQREMAVEPQYRFVSVKKDELIVGKGERVSREDILVLSELAKKQSNLNRHALLLGAILLLSLSIFVSARYTRFEGKSPFGDNKSILLAAGISVLTVALSKFLSAFPLPHQFLPASIAPMLVAILVDAHLAFVVALVCSLCIGIITGNNMGLMLLSLLGGIAGISSVYGARRRSSLLRAGLIVGLVNASCIVGIGLLNLMPSGMLLVDALWGIANGIFSSIIVLGILPLFEYIFKITTNISLLELSDLRHPILRELALKAPGTYHHSLVVGNLSESACEAIGANSLLARVGAYYHDIGKLEKPDYFSENQTEGKSRHDKLPPTMSALIITNHIRHGVELARKYKLNKSIINFICEHHGTGLIFFFYQRALERFEEESEIEEGGFRYPGPKPQTKETAVVLLADSIEAASRAFAEPTPARIKGLVRKIINNKFINGQLDECDLTLRDLNFISDAFTRILLGIHHARVEYPHST